MTSHLVVREYARLTTDNVTSSLDLVTVSNSAFDWLCQLQSRFSAQGAQLLQVQNRRLLRLDNFVGVVQTPCGTVIEILPKHVDEQGEDARKSAQALLCKMLVTALDLPVRLAEQADLKTFKHSLLEWVMQQFVVELDVLVGRSLRFDYQRVEETQHYLHGQLDMNKQLRQSPSRAHLFNIRHDVFIPDRAENRLLMSALLKVAGLTKHADTWRLAQELRGLLSQIPVSRDIAADFSKWKNERLMVHYQAVLPWCRLVLGQYMPLATKGETQGISLLFPMEKLFESYVEQKLRARVSADFHLKSQSKSEYLCKHKSDSKFQLRPDLLINQRIPKKRVTVLDIKWKRINRENTNEKYGLSQSDFYQMFAYGHKYLAGEGDMMLIYPKWTKLKLAIDEPFHFSDSLRLWVVPFDLEADSLCWPTKLQQLWMTTYS